MAFFPSTAPDESEQEVTRKPKTKASSGHIYIGVGGWTFEPWRGGVLSGKTCAGERAFLRRVEADLDRDQRHLLRLAKTGEFSQMGARGAGWFCVLAEGTSFCHQPPRAGRGRRFRQTVLRFRRAGARRPVGSGAVAVRADQEIRRGRFRQIPRAVAA